MRDGFWVDGRVLGRVCPSVLSMWGVAARGGEEQSTNKKVQLCRARCNVAEDVSERLANEDSRARASHAERADGRATKEFVFKCVSC